MGTEEPIASKGEVGADEGEGVEEEEFLKNSAEVCLGNGRLRVLVVVERVVIVRGSYSVNPVEDLEEVERWRKLAVGRPAK